LARDRDRRRDVVGLLEGLAQRLDLGEIELPVASGCAARRRIAEPALPGPQRVWAYAQHRRRGMGSEDAHRKMWRGSPAIRHVESAERASVGGEGYGIQSVSTSKAARGGPHGPIRARKRTPNSCRGRTTVVRGSPDPDAASTSRTSRFSALGAFASAGTRKSAM